MTSGVTAPCSPPRGPELADTRRALGGASVQRGSAPGGTPAPDRRGAAGKACARVRVREGWGGCSCGAASSRSPAGSRTDLGRRFPAPHRASLRPSSPSGRAKPPRFPWRPYCEVGVWSEQLLDGAPACEDKRPAGPPRPPWAPRPLAPRHPLPPPRPPLPQRNASGASLQGLFNELHISARTRGFNGLLYSVLQDSSANPAPAEGTSWSCK